jgi:hypothetical protein
MVVWAGEKGPGKLDRQPLLLSVLFLAVLKVATLPLVAEATKKRSHTPAYAARSDCAFCRQF